MDDTDVLFTTKFRLDLDPDKPIEIYDDIDYAGLGEDINNFVGVVRISGPTGLIYENTDFNSPDIIPSVSLQMTTVINLLLDPQNNYWPYHGQYTIKYSVKDTVSDITYENTIVYGFHFNEPTMDVNVESGAYSAKLRSYDLTDYGSDISTLTRVHTIHYPEGILPAPPPDIVSANDFVEVDPIYTNLWEITVATTVLYIQALDALQYSWSGSEQVDHCVFGACVSSMYSSIDTMLERYLDFLTTNRVQADIYRERLIQVNSAWSLLEIAWMENDVEEADKQATRIYNVINESGLTECSQGGSSTVVAVCPPWGGGGAPAAYTFDNGLTEVAGAVTLGGALTGETIITLAGERISIQDTDGADSILFRLKADEGLFLRHVNSTITGYVQVLSGVSLSYQNTGGPANVTYNLSANGLAEAADYSALYTDDTLISRRYFIANQGWGAQVVVSDASLSGSGTAGDPLVVANPFPGFTSLNADYGYVEPTHAFSEITATPTTIAGYGITDAVETFLDLTDTPGSYAGEAGKLLVVNGAEDEIEFTTASGWVPITGGTFTGAVTIAVNSDYGLILQQTNDGGTPGLPEAGINRISFLDGDGDQQGYVGIDNNGDIALSTSIVSGIVHLQNNSKITGTAEITSTAKIADELTLSQGTVLSEVADGPGVVGYSFVTPSYVGASALLLEIKNDVSQKFYVDKDGAIKANNIYIGATGNNPAMYVYTGSASGSGFVLGFSAGARFYTSSVTYAPFLFSHTPVYAANSALSTFEIQRGGTGSTHTLSGPMILLNENPTFTSGSLTGSVLQYFRDAFKATEFHPNDASDGSAVSYLFASAVDLTTAGDKIMSVRNLNTEKFYIDKDGDVYGNTRIWPDESEQDTAFGTLETELSEALLEAGGSLTLLTSVDDTYSEYYVVTMAYITFKADAAITGEAVFQVGSASGYYQAARINAPVQEVLYKLENYRTAIGFPPTLTTKYIPSGSNVVVNVSASTIAGTNLYARLVIHYVKHRITYS